MDRDREVTYGQLARAAGAVCHHLRESDIGRGDRVAVCAEKSIETVAALIGVLQAGAAYVPLDQTAPAARIGRQLKDARVAAMVTTDGMLGRLEPWMPRACAVLLVGPETDPSPHRSEGTRWDALQAGPPVALPAATVDASDPAYILYTSGSTGEPKGVVISHGAAGAFIDWSVQQFRLAPADRLSSHAPLHFDLSIFDIFAGLQAGATVVLVPRELSAFPRTLAQFIAEHRISVWYSVPSVLVALVRRGELERFDLRSLRTILFAGEVFASRDFLDLRAILPEVAYFNLYGPTETNVCTFHEVKELDAQTPIPIGRACPFAHVYVVREGGRGPARPGQSGELLVGGTSLMTEYWGRPRETRQVLNANNQGIAGTEVLYRTGDRVRLLEDGRLLFLDRLDSMVKRRGYRVELGEVEATLLRQSEVAEAAVLTLPPDQELVAFVVLSGRATGGSVRDACARDLPTYMLPDRIVTLDALPRTSTGKVDRVALRDRSPADASSDPDQA